MSAYLSSFFSLPVQRQSGIRLSHEEVINQLDNETVSYEIGLGISDSFSDTFRVSIKVEIAQYEKAIAWLKDLVYGAEFNEERCGFFSLMLHYRVLIAIEQTSSRFGQNSTVFTRDEKGW